MMKQLMIEIRWVIIWKLLSLVVKLVPSTKDGLFLVMTIQHITFKIMTNENNPNDIPQE